MSTYQVSPRFGLLTPAVDRTCFPLGLTSAYPDVTTQYRHIVSVPGHNFVLMYQNAYVNTVVNPGDTLAPNPIEIRASLASYPHNYQVMWNGQSSVTLEPGGSILSDPISIALPVGSLLFSRTYVRPIDGNVYPTTQSIYPLFTEGDNRYNSNKGGDDTMSPGGAYWITSPQPSFCGYGPTAIFNTSSYTGPIVGIIGDSVSVGVHDIPPNMGGFLHSSLAKAGIANLMLACPAESALAFKAAFAHRYRSLLWSYCTHVICGLGLIDISFNQPVEQVKASLQAIWNELDFRGIKVFQTTITPRQYRFHGVLSGFQSGCEPKGVRVQINDWIRTCPPPLAGFYDVASILEYPKNSCVWANADWTMDGTHPNAAGNVMAMRAINTSLIKI